MQSISKYILLSCIVGMTAVMISLVFYVYQTGNHSLQQFGTQLAQVFNSSGEPEFTKYVGRYVDGKTVRGELEKFGGQYLFRVKTKRNPISFCVVNRPVNNRIMTSFEGQGEYSDYSSSSSIYYINSSGLFSTSVLRDETGDIVGALFTEKGISVLTAGVKKAYAPTLADPTEDEVKIVYTEKLKRDENELNSGAIEDKTDYLKKQREEVEKERSALLATNNPNNSNDNDFAAYNSALLEVSQAKAKNNDAWNELINALQKTTGALVLGHHDITRFTPDATTDLSENDLQYWINKFNQRKE